jgi:hypothetical protein
MKSNSNFLFFSVLWDFIKKFPCLVFFIIFISALAIYYFIWQSKYKSVPKDETTAAPPPAKKTSAKTTAAPTAKKSKKSKK